jgi:DNA-binding XRE family transcriptional regulator
MAKKQKPEPPLPKFRNVAMLLDDHEMLREMASKEQRNMARQLSVLVRKAYAALENSDTV